MVERGNKAEKQIERNIAVHDKLARRYEARHGEIFNDIEQRRLRTALARARDLIVTSSSPPRALDFGCGSGNLTRHLLDLGFEVTAADVSPGFLQLVGSRNKGAALSLVQLNGSDLSQFPEAGFDLVATYSVLHHIPDYLAAVGEMARVCAPGGVVILDHEHSDEYWKNDDSIYEEFIRASARFDWRKYLAPSNYVHRIRRLFNPRHANEGDIHVWPDDHVEWRAIRSLLDDAGVKPMLKENYLLYRRHVARDVYDTYRDRCSDMTCMIFRKRTS